MYNRAATGKQYQTDRPNPVNIKARARQDASKRHDGRFHPHGDTTGVLAGSEHLQGLNPGDYTDDRNTADGQVIKGHGRSTNSQQYRFDQLKSR